MFVNAWRLENLFGVGDDGIAYLDADKHVRVNPRMLLEDYDSVAARVVSLGAGRWTVDDVRAALASALHHLLGHFEVQRGPLGTIVRISKAQRTRLKGDPNADSSVRIPNDGIDDISAQNGDAAAAEARRIVERAAMVKLANIVSRVDA